MPVTSNKKPSGSRRRITRLVVVAVLLTVAGIYLASRTSDAPVTPGTSSVGPVRPNTPAATANIFYNAICGDHVKTTTPGDIRSNDLEEVSGIVASRLADDAYWLHNDSGNSASIYSVDIKGKKLGTFNLVGTKAVDWEDIASGPGPVAGTPYLYVADTGDNTLSRGEVEIYRLPEPAPDIQDGVQNLSAADTLRFTFPDGTAHNIEAVFVDPLDGQIYFIDKSDTRPGDIYQAPGGLQDGSLTTLKKVGSLGYELSSGRYEKITAADISAGGDSIAVRSYERLYVYNRPAGSSVISALAGTACTLPKFSEPQGEAVGFKRDGLGLVTTGEGPKQPIHSFDITR